MPEGAFWLQSLRVDGPGFEILSTLKESRACCFLIRVMVYLLGIITVKTEILPKGCGKMDTLEQARAEIDAVDAQLAALFERRMAAVLSVAQ